MPRNSLGLISGGLIATLISCGGRPESFISQSPLGGANWVLNRDGVASFDRSPPTSPPSRSIEEADIYKLLGNTLYVLNQYRGLQIVDVGNSTAPQLLANVPIGGRPEGLYVRLADLAIVVVSDYFNYRILPLDGRAASPWRGSKVVMVNVSQSSSPSVLATLEIEGDVQDSRIVGNILYVFSQRFAWYRNPESLDTRDLGIVASFDLSNPRVLAPVDKLEFPASGWEIHANIAEDRVILSQSAWDATGPTTRFQAIDISDPGGTLRLGASFSSLGRVQNRWSMNYANGIFKAALQMSFNAGARLQIWSMATTSSVEPLGRLDLHVPEVLTAAGFDPRYAYLVTARLSDPLWIVDTQDPNQPRLTGQLSMPGQLDFVEPHGDRLVALGHTNEAGRPFQLQTSLLDVSDSGHPALLSRVTFGSSFGWVNVRPDDLRKAFQVLDSIGLILVPFQSWDYRYFTYQGGSQLIDFQPTSLTLRGFLPHAGSISRVFPIGSHLAALSDQSLQMIDASDRDHPVEMANLELARNVSTLALIGDQAVELAGDWYLGATELAVTDASDPNTPSPLARFGIAAPYASMFRDGSILWLLSTDYRNSQSSTLQAVDLSDPIHPRARGRMDLGSRVGFFFSSYWGYGNEAVLVGHALVLHSQVINLPYTRGGGELDCPGCTPQPPDSLKVINLADPDHPHLTATISLSGSNWSWGLRAFGDYAWLTHFEFQSESQGRYFVDRLEVSDPERPHLLPKVNVPGVFFTGEPNGRTFYTQEWEWHPDGSNPRTLLHKLVLVNDHTARLLASVALDGAPGGAAVGGHFAYVQLNLWSSPSSSTNISTVDLSSMHLTSTVPIQNQWAWVMKAVGRTLFVQASWYNQGVLLYDIADPAQPRFTRSIRTNGYVADVIVDEGATTAYLPTGYYGVERVALQSP